MNKHVVACEAIAESLEQAGRLDLAALCDRAAFWLDGSLDRVTLGELVQHCKDSAAALSAEQLAQQIVDVVFAIAQDAQDTEDVARLQAIALIANDLFGRDR